MYDVRGINIIYMCPLFPTSGVICWTIGQHSCWYGVGYKQD